MSDRDEEDKNSDIIPLSEEKIKTHSDDSEKNDVKIVHIDFEPLYLPKQRKHHAHNVVTTHDKNNNEADNSDETLCALKQLFQTDGTKQVSRGRISFREPIEKLLEYDKDRPLMAKLSNKVEYQSKRVKRNENVLNKLDGEVNIIRTDTSAKNNDKQNTHENIDIGDTQSKSENRIQKLLPKLIKDVEDINHDIEINPEEMIVSK